MGYYFSINNDDHNLLKDKKDKRNHWRDGIMNKIGLITRDNSGINAAVRSVVRMANYYDIDVIGFYHGYQGLINNDFLGSNPNPFI